MHLILLISSIHIATAAEIIVFSATVFGIPMITNDSIALNVELSNCSSSCSCYVQINETGAWLAVNFSSNSKKGFVSVKNLQPYTLHSFKMNCSEVIDTQTYAIHTDVSRPSPPLNTKIILVGQRLQLQWTPPSSPRGPIDEYRVTVDGIEVKPAMKNTVLSYIMNKDYVPGITQRMSVSACNTDTQDRTLCSNPKDAEVSYFQNTMYTTLSTQSSSINRISCVSILLMSNCLFLVNFCCMSVYI